MRVEPVLGLLAESLSVEFTNMVFCRNLWSVSSLRDYLDQVCEMGTK